VFVMSDHVVEKLLHLSPALAGAELFDQVLLPLNGILPSLHLLPAFLLAPLFPSLPKLKNMSTIHQNTLPGLIHLDNQISFQPVVVPVLTLVAGF
jgi:hypothetical protein